MRYAVRSFLRAFREVFHFQSDEGKGRVIVLASTLLTTVYNVFITGVFYTGFLSMYGMSITDTGILTYTPFLANLLSVFSPMILNRFKKRKVILLTSRIIFYVLYILAATIMPQFVQDSQARLTWFVVIVSVAFGFYALFSGGFTIWHYNFYPKDNELRLRYLTLSQIFSSILSSVIVLVSSFATDALSNSPHQETLILAFRYFAFVLVIIEIFVLAKAKEYPYQDSADLHFSQVFTLPFKYRKFLFCLIFMFLWNFIANLNNGLWNYHLLNHLDFSYTTLNVVAVLYTVCLLLLSSTWNKTLRKYSWIKTMGIAMLLFVPTEFIFFFMTKQTSFLYLPVGLYQHCMSVGLNLAYSNIFFMNLPSENSTAHLTFHTIGCNIFAFLGLLTGTWVSSITGDESVRMLGMDLYSVQFTTLIRGVLILVLSIILIVKWRSFTSDAEVERVDQLPKRRFF